MNKKTMQRSVSDGMGMIVFSESALQNRVRLWLTALAAGFLLYGFAAALNAQAGERDITLAVMRQEWRKAYTKIEGELSCLPQSADSSEPCVLGLKDHSSGGIYALQGFQAEALRKEFLAGDRKSASVEVEPLSGANRVRIHASR